MAHISQAELAEALAEATRKVEVGAKYTHYRNPDQEYKVLHLGFLEASEEPCVIYQAQYGAEMIWVRAVSDWLARVGHEGRQVSRFSKVD